MYKISISNEQKAFRVNRQRLVRLAEATLAAERIRRAEISVALVDDAHIHAINRKFLGHDYPTDVISFLLESGASRAAVAPAAGPRARRQSSKPTRAPGRFLDGEIIISTETAVQMAAEYGWRPMHELSLYLVHGLLHLCGYDDLTSDDQRIMREREVEVLGPWKIVPHYVA